MPKPSLSLSAAASNLANGYHFDTAGADINFTFPTDGSWYIGGEAAGYSALNATQQNYARIAVSLWDDLIVNKTVETQEIAGSLKFANTTTNIDYAHAYEAGRSIWFNANYGNDQGLSDLVDSPVVGQNGFKTYIHEIGHVLGLDHPSDYNGRGFFYERDAKYAEDSKQYSIMSYFDAEKTGATWSKYSPNGLRTLYSAQTPMLHDVAAIQAIYGADPTTRAGNTTYGFGASQDATRQIYDFSVNKNPIMTVYDAGGIDTLDVSGYSTGAQISLTAGTYSSFNGMTSNFAIAANTTIENVTTGDASDIISGNAANNRIMSAGGDDRISSGSGNDIVYSGRGNDKVNGGNDNDLIATGAGNDKALGGNGDDRIFGGAGNDKLLGGNGDDQVLGGAGKDMLYGNNGDDMIYGGGGNDRLYGGSGDDYLVGGSGKDFAYGGAGDDTYVYSSTLNIREVGSKSGGSDTVVTTKVSLDLSSFKGIENLTALTTESAHKGFTLTGNAGANVLTGSFGTDKLVGGAGNDRLIGNEGGDYLSGGGGSDTFVFNAAGGADRVSDFQNGYDKMGLSDVLAYAAAEFDYVGTDMFSDGLISAKATHNGTGIYFDKDGDAGNARHVLIGNILDVNAHMIDASDFIYV